MDAGRLWLSRLAFFTVAICGPAVSSNDSYLGQLEGTFKDFARELVVGAPRE